MALNKTSIFYVKIQNKNCDLDNNNITNCKNFLANNPFLLIIIFIFIAKLLLYTVLRILFIFILNFHHFNETNYEIYDIFISLKKRVDVNYIIH